jgi:[acyl-carrier-protein] S-malonyltransferase
MKAYIFPGQGAQYEGMGKDCYESSPVARDLFQEANEILGYSISDVMFTGSAEDLKQTKVTQPAVFLHSIAKVKMASHGFKPGATAGHSLGEFSALVAAGSLSFRDGLQLVNQRALAMQKACETVESTMAAVLGLDDEVVEKICSEIEEVVVPANYNCPGQLVISGTFSGVEEAVRRCQDAGAMKAVVLQVGGAFHSPLMQPAQDDLKAAIENTEFKKPVCPVYQNINALPQTNPDEIRKNLVLQLTGPVRWTQTMLNMISDGVTEFIEAGGTGKVLRGFVSRVDRRFPSSAL